MCNTKFSLNQKVKAIDGCGIAYTYWRYDENEIEPVQETSRPKVGDAVLIVATAEGWLKPKIGEVGIVRRDDKTILPFNVRFSDGHEAWFRENEVSPALKQYQIFAKLKPGMRVKSTRNGWLIVMPSCMASAETDCEFVLWNTEGCCQSKDSILDELQFVTVVYNAPTSFHDAFIPYKHGGEIVWDVSQYVDPIEAEKQRQRDDIKKQIAELEKQLTAIK